jgi:hypothetical protein
LNAPRKIDTPECSTSKLALEWTGSISQVPVGITFSVAVAVVIVAPFLPHFDAATTVASARS